MKYFVSILKQFSEPMRLIVLVLLLTTTTVSYLVAEYLKTDDCKPIIKENLKMHEDFAKISAMLRVERMKDQKVILDTIAIDNESTNIIQLNDNSLMDSIFNIVESNNK